MRFFSWVGGLVIVIVLGAAVGVSVTHLQSGSVQTLTASHDQTAGRGFDPRHRELDSNRVATPDGSDSSSSSSGSSGQPASRPPAAAAPAIVVNSTQQALINQDRARYGLGPLTWNNCLYTAARSQAAYLATPGVPFQHYGGVQQDLACHLGRQVGENIGWWSGGINDSQLNTMFMNSPEHKANILGPYTYVATAWAVRSDGYAYIAVEFG